MCTTVTSLLSRQYQETIAILQQDIEALETDRTDLEKKLDQTAKKGVLSDIKLISTKIKTLGGRGSPYGGSPLLQSPASSPYVGRRAAGPSVAAGAAEDGGATAGSSDSMESMDLQNPLLLSRVSGDGL